MFEFIDQIRWRPQIGDPTVMGWLTVAAYALAAVACWQAAARGGAMRKTWVRMTVLMALLCLNKQLDLQSLVTDVGRVIARNQGWYAERRGVQKVVVLATLAVSLGAAAWVLARFGRFWMNRPVLLAGIFFLATFIAVRAISFHHVDTLLRTRIIGVKMNWLLELSGIGLVWLAAVRDRPAGA